MEPKEKESERSEKSASILKSGVFLSLLTLFSRVLGLMREVVKSRFLGTSPLADAFTVSFLIPNLLRRLFAENSMTVAFIPTFKELIEKSETENDKRQEIKSFLSSIFTILTFFTTLVVILGIFLAPYILKILFPKLTDQTTAMILTRIMFPYLVFISIAAFFQGILNGIKIFTPSGFTPILFNLSVILFTYLFANLFANAAVAMSVGVTFGGFLQMVFQAPYVIKNNFWFNFTSLRTALQNKYTKKTLRLIAPTIIGMAAYQVNDLVSTSLATAYGTGIASSLQYSLRLQELLLGVFVVSVSSVILPDLSSFAIKKQWQSFETMLLQAMKIIALITIPASFFAYFCSEEIVSIIYKRHNFGIDSVRLTTLAFNYHIIGLFFIAINRVIAPAFYAMHDSDSPTIAGIASFFVNIACAVVLVRYFLGGGIAGALSIASFVNTIFLFFFLTRKHVINIKKIIVSIVFFSGKIACFSFIASMPIYLFMNKIKRSFISDYGINPQTSFILSLILFFLIFTFIGVILMIITKDETFSLFVDKIKNIIMKDKTRRDEH